MSRLTRLALALALAATVAGCESFDIDKINPFGEKKTPLSGERRPVFPSGVPGVSYSTPMGQPNNANIVTPAGGANAGTPAPGASTLPGN